MRRLEHLHKEKVVADPTYDEANKAAENEIITAVKSLAESLEASLTAYVDQPRGFFHHHPTASDIAKHDIVKEALKSIKQTRKLKVFDVVKISAFFFALEKLIKQNRDQQADSETARKKCQLTQLIEANRDAIRKVRDNYTLHIQREFLQFDIKILWLKLMLEEISIIQNDIENSWVTEYLSFLMECRNIIATKSADQQFFSLLEHDISKLPFDEKIEYLERNIKFMQQTRIMKDLYFNQYHLPEGSHHKALIERHRLRELRDDLLLAERKVVYQWLRKAEEDYHQRDLDMLSKGQIVEFSDWVRERLHFVAVNIYVFDITDSLRRSVFVDDILSDTHDDGLVEDFLRLSTDLVQDHLQTVKKSKVDIAGIARVGKRQVRLEEAWLQDVKKMSAFYLQEKDAELMLFANELVASHRVHYKK